MTTALWTVALSLSALVGRMLLRFRDVARIDIAGRIAIAFAGGLVFEALLLFVLAAAGVRWSWWSAGLPLAVLAAASALARTAPNGAAVPWMRLQAFAFGGVALVSTFGAVTARTTNADLVLFWGPKAVHFFHDRTIDVAFLSTSHYYLMHPDYPPLVPVTWAANSLLAGDFSYWGALWSTPILSVAAALIFRGFAAPVLGSATSTAYATLLLASVTLATAAGAAAGGADHYLILFESAALSALTFSEERGAKWVAAIALIGAVLAKVEGAAFVVVIAASLILLRRFRATVVVVSPAIVALVSWILFARHHELLDAYGRAQRSLHLENSWLVLATAGRHLGDRAAFLPWLAPVFALLAARSLTRARLPLLVCLATTASIVYFYLHEAQPIYWIRSSIERVMMIPLVSLVIAAAAATGRDHSGQTSSASFSEVPGRM